MFSWLLGMLLVYMTETRCVQALGFATDRTKTILSNNGVMRLMPVFPGEGYGSGSFQLNESETLLFGDLSGNTHAQFRVDRGAEPVRFLFTPRFRAYFDSAHCTRDTVKITFPSENIFQQARKDWEWVNHEEHNTIVLITHSEDCDVGDHDPHNLQAWSLLHGAFDDDSNTAIFSAVTKRLSEIAPDWRFTANSHGLHYLPKRGPSHGLQKRSKKGNIDLAKDFSGFGIPIGGDLTTVNAGTGAVGALTCDPCKTRGNIGFDIDVGPDSKTGVEGKIKFTTHGLGATLQTNLELWNSTDALQDTDHEIFGFVPEGLGIYIKGLVSIGPTFSMGYTLGLQKNPGLFALSAGLNVSVPDSELAVDILNSHQIEKHGWSINFDPLQPGMSSDVKLRATIGPYLSFSMRGNFVGVGGFETGVTYAKPELDVQIGNGAQSCAKNSRQMETTEVSVDIALKNQVMAFAGAEGPKGLEAVVGQSVQAHYTTAVASMSTKLFEKCVTVNASRITSPRTLPTTQVTSFVPQGIAQKIDQGIATAAERVSAAIPTITSIAVEVASKVVSVATQVESKATAEAIEDASKVASSAEHAATEVKSGLEGVGQSIGDALGGLFG